MDTPALSRDAIRGFDRYAIETLGLPGIVLMENAGRQLAEAARDLLAEVGGRRVVVMAGRGNNGGDGFVVARHLAMDGLWPRIALAAGRDEVGGDARTNLDVCVALGLEVAQLPAATSSEAAGRELAEMLAGADLAVDALLGTGTKGEVREPYATLIRALNDAAVPRVLAVDLPSGLDADTGEPLGPTVRAHRTVTMAARKTGFDAEGAAAYTGEVRVADIGVPAVLLDPEKRR